MTSPREEQREMEALLQAYGYDPRDAARLQDEGMGPYELESRLKMGPSGMGSLAYTHGLQRVTENPISLKSPIVLWVGGATLMGFAAGVLTHMLASKAMAPKPIPTPAPSGVPLDPGGMWIPAQAMTPGMTYEAAFLIDIGASQPTPASLASLLGGNMTNATILYWPGGIGPWPAEMGNVVADQSQTAVVAFQWNGAPQSPIQVATNSVALLEWRPTSAA